MLIVSAVKICKQCLQTDSASRGVPQTEYRGFAPGSHTDYSTQMKIFGLATEQEFVDKRWEVTGMRTELAATVPGCGPKMWNHFQTSDMRLLLLECDRNWDRIDGDWMGLVEKLYTRAV